MNTKVPLLSRRGRAALFLLAVVQFGATEANAGNRKQLSTWSDGDRQDPTAFDEAHIPRNDPTDSQRRKRSALEEATGLSSYLNRFHPIEEEKRPKSSFRGDLGKRRMATFAEAIPVDVELPVAGENNWPTEKRQMSSRFRGDLGKRARSSFRGDLGKRARSSFRGDLGKRAKSSFRGDLGKREDTEFEYFDGTRPLLPYLLSNSDFDKYGSGRDEERRPVEVPQSTVTEEEEARLHHSFPPSWKRK